MKRENYYYQGKNYVFRINKIVIKKSRLLKHMKIYNMEIKLTVKGYITTYYLPDLKMKHYIFESDNFFLNLFDVIYTLYTFNIIFNGVNIIVSIVFIPSKLFLK